MVNHHKGSLQIHQPHGGHHNSHVHGTHCLFWCTSIDVMVAMADPTNRPDDTDPRGWLILNPVGSSSVNDQAISLKPRGGIFGQGPEVSGPGSPFTWHTASGELWERLRWNHPCCLTVLLSGGDEPSSGWSCRHGDAT